MAVKTPNAKSSFTRIHMGVESTMARSGYSLLLCSLLAACGSGANIRKIGGELVRGKITHSDQENIYVQSYGAQKEVARKDVYSIDHPGNVLGNIGVGGTIIGGYYLYLYQDYRDSYISADAQLLLVGIAASATGLVMMIVGYSDWYRSRSALKPMSESVGLYLPPSRLFGRETVHLAGMQAVF